MDSLIGFLEGVDRRFHASTLPGHRFAPAWTPTCVLEGLGFDAPVYGLPLARHALLGIEGRLARLGLHLVLLRVPAHRPRRSSATGHTGAASGTSNSTPATIWLTVSSAITTTCNTRAFHRHGRATMGADTTEIIARAVIRRDDRILLARQHTKSWSFLPGGHVEPGERVELALVRELGEELGTEAKIAGFVGVVEHGYVEDNVTHHELNLVFEVAIANGEPVSQEDHLIVHWLPLDQLADTDVRPGSLKNALVAAGNDRTPFWHAWNG